MSPNFKFPTSNMPNSPVTYRMPKVVKPTPVETQRIPVQEVSAFTVAKQRIASAVEQANRYGIGIVHVFNPNYPKGGMTIAFKKCNDYRSGYMVEVAVNTCSPEDTFNKRIGTAGAIEKFLDGHTIELPLLRCHDLEDINGVVKEAFTNMAHYMLLI